jgi:hypothetical protein
VGAEREKGQGVVVQATAALVQWAATRVVQTTAQDVLTQEPLTKVQSTSVTAPPTSAMSVFSSRCLRVSRLRVSLFLVFFTVSPPSGPWARENYDPLLKVQH